MEDLSHLLKYKGITVSVAESCTGGLLASHLTDISGSSKYFIGGVVAYSTHTKTTLLNVPECTEVVSAPCAVAMNHGLKNIIKSDVQVSVTGNIGIGNNPELSNTVFFSILYNYIDYVFKIDLEDNFSSRNNAKLYIVSVIIDKIYRVVAKNI